MSTPHDELAAHLDAALASLTAPVTAGPLPAGVLPTDVVSLLAAQVASREVDLATRRLRAAGRGYYSISSAGHEGNAMVAAATRLTDPALLHYRSGAFYQWRADAAGLPGVDDVLLGVMAATSEPISGGRHKVFGRSELAIIPQTSTIASHLPRAVGLALALSRAPKVGATERPFPDDAVVVCSFGDASLNHATAQAALNTAAWVSHQGLPVPVLFVCEHNGLGISVPTPRGWVEERAARTGMDLAVVDGAEPLETLATLRALVARVRHTRRPGFVVLRCVRFLGHAGTDVEAGYRSATAVRDDLARDPVVATARAAVAAGVLAPEQVDRLVRRSRTQVAEAVARAVDARPLTSAVEVMAALAPRRPAEVAARAAGAAPPGTEPLTLAQGINAALDSILATEPACVFGEDVGRKGGVYGLTRNLQARHGQGKVFDTLLDETSILGLALGFSLQGILPIPEIQYLAYLHNAEDQLRGEAASLAFFSNGQYRNGMVVRIAGLGYQKGFGGHFHNDDGVAVLRDVPGLVVGCPSRADDAWAMLHTLAAAGRLDGTVSVLLEPIALYHERDLAPGDGGWAAPLPPAGQHVPIGAARTYGDGTDLSLIAFGNGVPMSLRVADRLRAEGASVRVLDLRWLLPLPAEDLLAAAATCGRVLVVDETRRAGGVGEGVLAELVEGGFTGPMARVSAKDSFVPLGDAARLVFLAEAEIEEAARALLQR
jgi:2-oxoisovalerate dehydrogenase E1 component